MFLDALRIEDGLFVLNLYINRKLGFASGPALERRILILPVAWALYGLLLVFGLQTLLGTIPQNLPYPPNDKPIGGSELPVLFFNATTIIAMVLLTLYSTGYWTPDLSSNRAKLELGSVAVLLLSGFMLWYYPVFVFTAVAAVVLLMATNLE